MPIASRAAGVQNATVLVLIPLTALLVMPSALSAFSTPKSTAVLAGGVVLVAAGIVRAATTATIWLPRGAFAAVVLLLAAAVLVSAAAADVRSIAWLGAYRRNGGALQYLTYMAVLLVVVRRYDVAWLHRLLVALLVSAGAVAVGGLLRSIGVIDVALASDLGVTGLSSTLGNPNFASGYIAIGLAPLAWAFTAVRQIAVKAALAAVGIVLAAALALTSSAQGPLAAVAGLSFLGLAWARSRGGTVRRLAWPAWVGAATLGTVLLGFGFAEAGPLAGLGRQRSFQLRRWYWDTAVAMFSDNPLLGQGLDHYGVFYRQFRPVAAVLDLPLELNTDAAHSVPLQMLSGGGVVLAVAYLALVGFTGAVLVIGMRTADPRRTMLLGGLGGAWMSYQIQSFVSIDVPPLALAHFALAGGVIAASGVSVGRELSIPGLRPLRARRDARRQWIIAAAAALVVVPGLYGASLPLRADLAAGAGRRFFEQGDGTPALAALNRSIELAPWQAAYHLERGYLLVSGESYEPAFAAFDAATLRDPGDIAPPLSAARGSAALGAADKATRYYDRSLTVEPLHPALKVEAANFAFNAGDTARAAELAEDALSVDPDNAEAAALLNDIAAR